MKTYAIVQIGPFQYTVEEGKTYTVPKFQAEEGKDIKINEVLAVGTEEGITVGKPHVAKATVEISVDEQGKGEKITTQVYKSKSRYRRKKGFRKRETTFTVKKISVK